MPTEIRLPNGSTLRLEIAPPAPRESFFVFGVHKGGSVMLNRLLGLANAELGIPEILIPIDAYRQGLHDDAFMAAAELESVLHPRGYCYGGFRYFPPFLAPFFAEPRRAILLVRDPRDILTSLYFSVTGSHSITKGEMGAAQLAERERLQNTGIDAFAMEKVAFVRNEFASYEPLLASDRTQVWRYEDVVFQKSEWLADMLAFLGESLPAATIEAIATRVHRVPQQEQPGKHTRKVTPGDHKEKLQPDTIAALNEAFSGIFAKFGYSAD